MQPYNPEKTFIIAEAGVNHNGSLDTAMQLIDVAVKAGADAVKFQTFIPENLVTDSASKADYQIANTARADQTQRQMLENLALPFEDFTALKDCCDRAGIIFLSTPFDLESAYFLAPLVDIFKIPSGEITNLPFLAHIASFGKPIILSTGMSNLDEVARAVEVISQPPKPSDPQWPPLTLLHCCTNYPCPVEQANLNAISTLKNAFNLPTGYSDHTMGTEIALAAVAMGATVIEKHFTLDRSMPGPDHKASLVPDELACLVKSIRKIASAMGDGVKIPTPDELIIRDLIRKSLVARTDIHKGTVITRDMLAIKRPGTGIPPADIDRVIGMKIALDKQRDTVLSWTDFENLED